MRGKITIIRFYLSARVGISGSRSPERGRRVMSRRKSEAAEIVGIWSFADVYDASCVVTSVRNLLRIEHGTLWPVVPVERVAFVIRTVVAAQERRLRRSMVYRAP